MLTALAIRDVVLIDRLDLEVEAGLSVLTGETGAGKSILLDALGLALGERADSGLVRHGRDQASVTATFEIGEAGAIDAVLDRAGLDPANGALVLRRMVSADGRSRAYVNDQPTSVGLLRQLGDALVEIQGQFDQRGLMDPSTHRRLLDAFAGLEPAVHAVDAAWRTWQEARETLESARRELEDARRDEDYLRHAIGELDQVAPQAGEQASLLETRTVLANAEAVIEGLNAARLALAGQDGGDGGADSAVALAQRALDRIADRAGGRLESAVAALDRAAAELQEAESEVTAAADAIEADSGRLTEIDDRLHVLRDLARKHDVDPDQLPEIHRRIADHLAALDGKGGDLGALIAAAEQARTGFEDAASRLSRARADGAVQLDTAVGRELQPLKLDKARFETALTRLPESQWGPSGIDSIVFNVATNPGMPAGPLSKIASGGELSRFLLALKVVLAEANPVPTLVFDEVDSGVGGAVAAAVGDRLARLGGQVQVLVVTHSPQVAARGLHHWHVAKRVDGATTATEVTTLDRPSRLEEIARMLSGSAVTAEARAAAESLLTQLAGVRS